LKRTGLAELPLHYGKAPSWLVKRMMKLAKGIIAIIVEEYGHDVLLQRLSDPYWFQALGCVLGYDWHSSGVTTVVTGVLKAASSPEESGIAVCGGKGRASTQAPKEILKLADIFDFSTEKISSLQYASRMSAKVDNTAVQDGYPLYHHAFFIAEDGKWAVIQQGMSARDRTARRYHWLSDQVRRFVVEPHNAIAGDKKREVVLDMTARESDGCRKASVDIVKEDPKKVARMLESIRPSYQRSLREWMPQTSRAFWKDYVTDFLSMPATLNWKAIRKAYEFQPVNYEDLLGIRGIGPSTVRGLALVSAIVYGEKPSWKDPVKYSFAYGGKDGVPFPVDRKAMDDSIQILEEAIRNAKLGDMERLRSIQRLERFIPQDIET